MKRIFFFTVFGLLITATVYAGQIQISTYYPSPFGYYERLKFNPRSEILGQCEPGTVYYLSGTGLKYCAEDTTWKNIGGSVWDQNVNDIYPINTATNPNLKVGIGTDAPTSSLHVYAPEGYAPAGVFLDTADIDVNGGPDGQFRLRNNSTSGTQKMFFGGSAGDVLTVDTQAGRVGIGTTTPGIKLSVYDTTTTGKPLLFLAAPSLADNEAIGMWLGRAGSTDESAYILYRHDTTASERNLQFGHIGAAPKMVIENSGNVGIGTTTPNNRIQVTDLINFDNTWFGTMLGYQAGNVNNANNNTFVGYHSGLSTTTGAGNTCVGSQSGQSNTTGTQNIFLGAFSGENNIDGNDNTFIGWNSGKNNISGSENTFVGRSSGATNTASFNTFLGYFSGRLNTTGGQNTFIGHSSGAANTTGAGNTFVGSLSGPTNTTGGGNTFIGGGAGGQNTIGSGNTFVGGGAGATGLTGVDNTFVGYGAGSNSEGNENVFMGYAAGASNTTGSENVFYGDRTGANNTTGIRNIFLGSRAGLSNTTGNNNILIGYTVNAPAATTSNFLNIGDAITGDLATGNVGIGTPTPGTKLDVNGPIRPQQYAPGTSETASQSATVRIYDNIDCNQSSEEGKIVYKNDRNAGELCFCARGNAGANYHWFCLSTASSYW